MAHTFVLVIGLLVINTGVALEYSDSVPSAFPVNHQLGWYLFDLDVNQNELCNRCRTPEVVQKSKKAKKAKKKQTHFSVSRCQKKTTQNDTTQTLFTIGVDSGSCQFRFTISTAQTGVFD